MVMSLLLLLGGIGKMRRNHENTNEVVQYNHSDLQIIKQDNAIIKEQVYDLAIQMKKATFHTLMDTVDLSEFFPVEREAQLEDFMDRTHVDWPARRREFYNYMFNCITPGKKGFAKGLMKTLFSREFMWTTKWPTFG